MVTVGDPIMFVLYTCADIQLSSGTMFYFTGDAASVGKRKWKCKLGTISYNLRGGGLF